jgi:phosphoribosylglycinamide formyltransferase-1
MADTSPKRVAVLISGRGSNMQALVERAQGYEVVLVASDNPDAAGLVWAAARGIPTFAMSPREHGRQVMERSFLEQFAKHDVQAIALAGYMRILTPSFINALSARIVNIHPSLLPLYKGLDTHARALAAGDTRHGCSVHIVTEELDAGEVLGQAEVSILAGDTPEALAERVLAEEHRLYPRVLSKWLTR